MPDATSANARPVSRQQRKSEVNFRFGTGCPSPRQSPRDACARGFVPTRIKILKLLIFKGFSRYAWKARPSAMHCDDHESLEMQGACSARFFAVRNPQSYNVRRMETAPTGEDQIVLADEKASRGVRRNGWGVRLTKNGARKEPFLVADRARMYGRSAAFSASAPGRATPWMRFPGRQALR
jgi:hypothetical protein